jgi:hypothetical protein
MVLAVAIQEPQGEPLPDHDRIQRSLRRKDLGYIALGFADRLQRKLELDDDKVAFVDMNKSGRIELRHDEEGIIATSSLAGCTGVAGFVRENDGSVHAFISHYDPMSQNSILTGEDSLANRDMYRFNNEVQDEDINGGRYLVVVVPDGEYHNPEMESAGVSSRIGDTLTS